MARSKGEGHPATGKGSAKRGIERTADKGGVPRRGKLGSLKPADDAATRNARGMWREQGRKDATIKGDADHTKRDRDTK